MQPETTVLFIKEKGPPMKKFGEFVVSTFVAGLLIIVPIYLAVLLLLKAMQSVVAFVKPFALCCSLNRFRLNIFSLLFSCCESAKVDTRGVGGTPIKIEYKLHLKSGQWKVYETER